MEYSPLIRSKIFMSRNFNNLIQIDRKFEFSHDKHLAYIVLVRKFWLTLITRIIGTHRRKDDSERYCILSLFLQSINLIYMFPWEKSHKYDSKHRLLMALKSSMQNLRSPTKQRFSKMLRKLLRILEDVFVEMRSGYFWILRSKIIISNSTYEIISIVDR